MYANRWNFRTRKEIGVEEHDGDVRFFTGSGNTTVSRMRNASGHNYGNRSFILDVCDRGLATDFVSVDATTQDEISFPLTFFISS